MNSRPNDIIIWAKRRASIAQSYINQHVHYCDGFIHNRLPLSLQAKWNRLNGWIKIASCVVLFVCGIVLLTYCYNKIYKLDANTYYYLYRTIAQSLASAFAFLVAVTLYRMEYLERSVENALHEVIQHAHADHVNLLTRKARAHDWEDIDNYITDDTINNIHPDEMKSFVSTNWRYFREGKQNLETLKHQLVKTLRLTSLVIGSSLALIPFSRILQPEQSSESVNAGTLFSVLLLVAMIFLACRCLFKYWEIARRLTDRKPKNIYMTVSTGFNLSTGFDVTGEVRHCPTSPEDSPPPSQG